MEQFEWRNKKNEINKQKHDVDFEEASTVFEDFLAIYKQDVDHSIGEERSYLIGNSINNRLIVVSFTEREKSIRIISARLATKLEKNIMKTKTKILETECDYLEEDIPEEIDFSNGKPNPFINSTKVIVEIAPDIAKIFRNAEEVNNALRILLSAIPKETRAKAV